MKQLSTVFFIAQTGHQIYRSLLLLSLIWLNAYTVSSAQVQAISNTNQTLNAISYGVGQWVAAGNNGTILTSPDGITWTNRSSGTTAKLTAISYGGGQWIVVGDNGTILTSPDGIIWTARNSGTTDYLYDISYGGSQWIIVTSTSTLASPDGINWTARGTPGVSIIYGKGQWASVNGNQFQTSTDGITWASRSIGYDSFFKVRYGGGRWILLSSYGPIVFASSSPDGINWQTQAIGDRYNRIQSIAFGNGLWVGVGVNRIITTSSDGINWSTPKLPQFSYPALTDVSYGGDRWVMVGAGGTILYTNNALPVSLVAFQGKAEGNAAHLTWQTAWEKGASHFLVERSRDAKSFEAVGRLEAQGTTNMDQHYSFLDEGLAAGLWYYRLRQVDLDGTFTHSQIVAVRIGSEPLDELTLSPTPSSGPMTLENKAGISSVAIYSVTGRLVHQQLFWQNVNQWTWDGVNQPTGTYLIKIQTPDGKVRTLRWLKQ